MTKRLGFIAFVFALLAITGTATASNVIYDTWTGFNAAAPGLPIEDFEEANVADGAIASMNNPLDMNTNNGIFSTGDILNGLQITSDSGLEGALAIPGAGFAGIVPSKSVFGNYFGSGLDADFSGGGVFAVGLDLYSYTEASDRVVDVFGASGLLGSFNLNNVATAGTFFGIISSEAITKIHVDGVTGYTIGFDNIAFGAPIPEPTSLFLLATGLGVMGLAAWRRKK